MLRHGGTQITGNRIVSLLRFEVYSLKFYGAIDKDALKASTSPSSSDMRAHIHPYRHVRNMPFPSWPDLVKVELHTISKMPFSM